METHYVWPAPLKHQELNDAILPYINRIVGLSAEVFEICSSPVLEGKVYPPFLENNKGFRHFGKDPIRRYCKSY